MDPDEKKRKILPEDEKSAKKPSANLAGSLHLPPTLPTPMLISSPSTNLNSHAGVISQGATFAVWNLCDLGGGHQSAHWRNNTEGCLDKLPDQLKDIEADVLGLLEIKTGHLIINKSVIADLKGTTAFKVGAMTALMFFLAKKETYLKGIENRMWTGDDQTPLIEGLACGLSFCNQSKDFLPLIFEVEDDDLNEIIPQVISGFADLIIVNSPSEHKEKLTTLFKIMVSICNLAKRVEFTMAATYSDSFLVNKPVIGEVQNRLKVTFKDVQDAFGRGGVTIKTGEEKNLPKEADGIPLITKVLDKFKTSNKNYEYWITTKVDGEGETTAFVFNKNKFKVIRHGSMPIKGSGWQFRGAGFVLLECLQGILNVKQILVVAWHAPSENHVGNRWQAYTELLSQIRNLNLDKNTKVVLLADMNIRQQPAKCENGIIEEIYDNWLPKPKVHMKVCTSLKKTGSGGNQWNHPFDKVLLLKDDKDEFEFTDYAKMNNSLSAEKIRVYSDHSWVKMKITVKK